MTKEEAIIHIGTLRTVTKDTKYSGKAIDEAVDMAIKALDQENNLPHCQYTDAEITKSFIEDVETVKDQLPCGEQMDFPNTFDEFAKDYGFKDRNEIYTNGSELIPVFRVKQWLEHISVRPQPKTGHWRPIKTRPLTEKEKEYFVIDAEFIYECDLPDDGETVLITDKWGNVDKDTFCRDDGCYFEDNCGEDDVVAWMPLPEPYKAESEGV